MVERHLLPSGREAGGRIPALEPCPRVVAPVWIVAVPDEPAGDLDLVRGVVVVIPRLGRLAQAGLQQDGRDEQRDGDDERQPGKQFGAPCTPLPPDDRDNGDREGRDDPGRADEAEIPVTSGGANERTEGAVRMHGRRVKRPGVRPELRHDDRHERSERSEDRPRAGPADSHRAGTASRDSVTAGAGGGCGRGCSRKAAATPSTSHVIGSSKNPLYASEWTKRAKKTAASDSPRAW